VWFAALEGTLTGVEGVLLDMMAMEVGDMFCSLFRRGLCKTMKRKPCRATEIDRSIRFVRRGQIMQEKLKQEAPDRQFRSSSVAGKVKHGSRASPRFSPRCRLNYYSDISRGY
jgi:hypothetical protein